VSHKHFLLSSDLQSIDTLEFFVQKSFLAAFSSYALALAKNSYKKFACKTLMKLTADINAVGRKTSCL